MSMQRMRNSQLLVQITKASQSEYRFMTRVMRFGDLDRQCKAVFLFTYSSASGKPSKHGRSMT